MSGQEKTKVLFTWKPQRGMEQMRAAAGGMEVQATDSRDEAVRLAGDAEVLVIGDFDAEILRAARKLKWVHGFMAGVNSMLFPEWVASPIPMTCLKGLFDIPAAEHTLAMMLAFSRKLEYDIRCRATRTWQESEPDDLHGKTVGIVGLGSMGAEIARRCKAFGMRVLGLARQSPQTSPHRGAVDEMLPATALPRLLGESDFVVVAVPLTAQTQGLIGAKELAAMKPTAYLIDISGRPAVYDIPAITRALESGQIAGAALQMVPPKDSPLWEVDRLMLSLHRVVSRGQFDRCVEQFCENMRRYREGRPLLGLVDKAAGY